MHKCLLYYSMYVITIIVCLLFRRLGEVATENGCSTILAHIRMLKDGNYVLNVANSGIGEAILCRSGRPVPLTTPHDPGNNPMERTRIADSRGFVSQVKFYKIDTLGPGPLTSLFPFCGLFKFKTK